MRKSIAAAACLGTLITATIPAQLQALPLSAPAALRTASDSVQKPEAVCWGYGCGYYRPYYRPYYGYYRPYYRPYGYGYGYGYGHYHPYYRPYYGYYRPYYRPYYGYGYGYGYYPRPRYYVGPFVYGY